MGPLTNPTHTECQVCGGVNCQTEEYQENPTRWTKGDDGWYLEGGKYRVVERTNYGNTGHYAIEEMICVWMPIRAKKRFIYRETLEAAQAWCEENAK